MKNMVEKFLCPGCMHGCDTECGQFENDGTGCSNHYPSTFIGGRKIALGLPKGFNTITENTYLYLYENQEEQEKDFSFDILNLPVWTYEEDGYLFVKVLSPRINNVSVLIIKGGKKENINIGFSARDTEAKVEKQDFVPITLDIDFLKKID